MNAAWQVFIDELACWREAGRQVDFWWRDDDASGPDPALARLTALAQSAQVPLALAVIPETAQAAIFNPAFTMVSALQHGAGHHNLAAPGEKKTEFPVAEPVEDALARLANAQVLLAAAAGDRALPVLVPPWNRIASPRLVARLAGVGYCGLSTFGPRRSAWAAPGLVLVNTHVDIIDWRGSRGFVGEELALAQATQHLQARRSGQCDATEPTGWLTHHAVHDAPAWAFLALLFERTRDHDGVAWRSAASLFRPPSA